MSDYFLNSPKDGRKLVHQQMYRRNINMLLTVNALEHFGLILSQNHI